MPTPPADLIQKIAAFHQAHPAPAEDAEGVYSPIRLTLDLPDPTPAAEGMVAEFQRMTPNGLNYSHAELMHEESRNIWNLLVWFKAEMSEEHKELRDIFQHTEGRDFPTLKQFKNFLLEVLPLPAYNRASQAIDKAGVTELLWQQERVQNKQPIGVRPSDLFRKAMAQGGKPIMFGDAAKKVRDMYSPKRKEGGK